MKKTMCYLFQPYSKYKMQHWCCWK